MKRRTRAIAACLGGAALVATAMGGCGGSHQRAGPTASASPPGSAGPTATHRATKKPRRPATSPFTGRRRGAHRRVLAVKVDNTSNGRPQLGLTKADIVYVEQVEGGLSRIMGVFSSHLPKHVGPVRSARISDLHILRQFGHPAFAYSGAQHKMLPLIAKAPLYDVSPAHAGGAYRRSGGRPVPYNEFASPRALLHHAPKAARARDIGFRFGAAPPGGRRRASVTVRYPAATLTFRWSPHHKRWLVWMDGSRDVSVEGPQLGPRTLVIQWCHVTRSRFHDFLGNYTPLIKTTGKGTGMVLRNGRVWPVHWSKRSLTAPTKYTVKGGRRMTFARGQVWVVLDSKTPRTP